MSGMDEKEKRPEGGEITVNRAWMESLLELAMAYIEEHGERDKNGELTCRFPDDPGGGRHSRACSILSACSRCEDTHGQ